MVETVKRKARDVHFVVDVSGSMDGAKLAAVKKATIDFVGSLHDRDGVSLHAFSDKMYEIVGTPSIFGDGQAPPLVLKKNATDFPAKVNALKVKSNTALYDAIVASVKYAKTGLTWNEEREKAMPPGKKGDSRVPVLVILTDGEDTASKHADLEAACTAIQKPGMPAIKVFLVAVGEAIDTPAVRRLSELKCVEVVNARDAANISAAFTTVQRRLEEILMVKTTTVHESKRISAVHAGGGGAAGGGAFVPATPPRRLLGDRYAGGGTSRS
jgi:uncharacterized protein YegL